MKAFTEHPASVGESYAEHCAHATGFGLAMVGGGLACLVHALLPFLFVRTGSGIIDRLHERMVVNRAGRARAPRGGALTGQPAEHRSAAVGPSDGRAAPARSAVQPVLGSPPSA